MNYTYTRRGLMDKVKFNGKEIADYDYNANGAVSSTDYGLGTIESELNYDNRQRLTSITAQKDGDGKKLFAQTYEYDNLGNRTKLTGTYGGEIGYQYDDLDRLQVVDYPGNKRKLFNYDKEGNREKLVYQHGSGTDNNYKYSYDYNQNNNQLNYYTLSDYTKYDYSYNNNGSVTSKKLKRGGETLRETTYKYDLKDQLRQMTVDGHQINFKYNEKGWRIKKDNGIRTTYYLYGKGQQVLEERNGTNQLKKLFIYGANGKIATVGDKGKMKYVISDQLGSSSVITNEKGEELVRYKYSPFGNLIKSKGETKESYRFTGKEFDKLTGLYYYGARYYDPTIGRFISEDPVKDGWNWYAYTANNPLRYVDPNGLLKKDKVFAGGIQFIGGIGQGGLAASSGPLGMLLIGGHSASNVVEGGAKIYNGLIIDTPVLDELPRATELNLIRKYGYQKLLGKKWGKRAHWIADTLINIKGTWEGGKELLGEFYGYPFARKGGEIVRNSLGTFEATNQFSSLSKLTVFGLMNDIPGYKMQWENKPEFNMEYKNNNYEYNYGNE